MNNASVAIQVLPKVLEQEETRRIVDAVIAYIASTGVRYVVGPFETTLELSLIHISCSGSSPSSRGWT